MALRISTNSKFALFVQPDAKTAPEPTALLPHAAVNFLPEQPNAPYRYVALKAGESVPVLSVVATASNEPDYGLDINLCEDCPSDWGKVYGFGKLPFGNPTLYFSTQAPFHMGFYHQDWLIFKAAPFIKRTFPLMRIHQYSSLAALAFRTGHPYWGLAFYRPGFALHAGLDPALPRQPGTGRLELSHDQRQRTGHGRFAAPA